MAEIDYKIVLGIIGAVTAAWGVMAKMFWNSFTNHKKAVQYKDTCAIQVKNFEDKLDSNKELMETKFGNLEKGIEDVKELIKDGAQKDS